MSESTLDFRINGNKNMDIRDGVHGIFSTTDSALLSGGVTHTVLSDYGDMLFQGIPFLFGSIWLSRYHIRREATLSAEANAPSLEIMHLLSGNISFEPQGLMQKVSMKEQHWQMMYLPQVSNKVFFPAGTRLVTLDIHYKPEYLESMAVYFKDLDRFLDQVAKGIPGTLCRQPFPLQPEVQNLLAKFFLARNTERDQNLFMERHMVDWLASSLESPYLSGATPLGCSQGEYQRMLDIKAYMTHHFAELLSISVLARMAQMNEYKFKRLFTELFKTPVRQFLIEVRLKKALELLTGTRMSVAEIALACGYETPAALTKIFRLKYGRPPSAFR